ncbi:hypothetical protein DFH06DRAFT_1317359 [Mycena polygramma]|nr:hypothetical protein DFH06DRAFT_1318061 [Mycena polygramma]KAJ7676751.1 hypothetical protein DFH06DRAFT_1317359 [Mycena polygramma]
MRISIALFALSAASVAFGRQCDICPNKVMKGKAVYYLANDSDAYDDGKKIYICGYQEHIGDANNEGDWNCIYSANGALYASDSKDLACPATVAVRGC